MEQVWDLLQSISDRVEKANQGEYLNPRMTLAPLA
jgi:hypothetical protein